MTDGSQTVRALNILAPIEVHKGLKELARTNRRSMSQEARVALEVRIVGHKAQLDRQPSATTKAAA